MRARALLLLLVLLATPSQARSIGCSGDLTDPCTANTRWAVSMFGTFAIAASAGLIAGVGNSVFVHRGSRAPTSWLVTGVVAAGLNFAVTALSIVTAVRSTVTPSLERAVVALGVTSAIIGSFDVVITLLGQNLSPRVASWVPRPMLLGDGIGFSTALISF